MARRVWPSICNPPWDSPRSGRAAPASTHARSAKDERHRRVRIGDIRRPPRSHACSDPKGATVGQTAVGGKDPRRVCMTRCRAEPESVLKDPYSGPRQHPGRQPSELELPRAPPLRRWSHPPRVVVPQAHQHKPQPQTLDAQLQAYHSANLSGPSHWGLLYQLSPERWASPD
eukprot:1177542-Pleurochrysis_carterae.AAC.1